MLSNALEQSILLQIFLGFDLELNSTISISSYLLAILISSVPNNPELP